MNVRVPFPVQGARELALKRPEQRNAVNGRLHHAHFDAGIAHECISNRSADHAEAVRAFRDRRKPAFTGR